MDSNGGTAEAATGHGWVAAGILASIAVPNFVQGMETTYDHKGLHDVTKFATKNLDKCMTATITPSRRPGALTLSTGQSAVGSQAWQMHYFCCITLSRAGLQ